MDLTLINYYMKKAISKNIAPVSKNNAKEFFEDICLKRTLAEKRGKLLRISYLKRS